MTTRQLTVNLQDFGDDKPKIVYKPEHTETRILDVDDPNDIGPCAFCEKNGTKSNPDKCTKKQAQECSKLTEWILQ